MNCFNHTDRTAVAQCNQCGKFLCKECASKWKPVLCDSCAEGFIRAERMAEARYFKPALILFTVVLAIRLFSTIAMAVGVGSIPGLILGVVFSFVNAAMIGGIPYGWRKLNMISSYFDFILILPIMGWIIVFGLKLILAMLIGWIFFVPKLVTYFRDKGNTENIELSNEMKWKDIFAGISGKFRKRSYS